MDNYNTSTWFKGGSVVEKQTIVQLHFPKVPLSAFIFLNLLLKYISSEIFRQTIVQDLKSCSDACKKEQSCCTFEWSETQQKFVRHFLNIWRKQSRLDISGATFTITVKPRLRNTRTTLSAEKKARICCFLIKVDTRYWEAGKKSVFFRTLS